MKESEEIKQTSEKKKWNVTLKVSFEEEKKIKIGAINMGMGVADYIKQAALEKFPNDERYNPGKLN